MANEFTANPEALVPEHRACQGGTAGRSTAASRVLERWGIVIVLALTFAVYIPTLRFQFVHDDRGQIVENPAVHSWHFVPTYFTAHVWAAVMPEELGNYYRPLFLLWLRINDVVFGSHAWGWHLTTVLAHLLTTLLVYLLACRLKVGRDVALLAALIFGLHPAHIEAVAWVSGVTEPLLGILLIASLLAYLRSRTEDGRLPKWKLVSLGLFALAMLEKETALILPGLLVVYEWTFGLAADQAVNQKTILAWCRKTLGSIWPYFALIALYVPLRIYALKGFSHAVTPLRTAQLIFTWPSLIAFWIRHLVWPAGLSTFYDFPAVLHPTFTNFVWPAIFDVCVGIVLIVAARRSRTVAFFAVWLVLPLIPLLNLRVFVANDFAHDRYLYLPSVGFAVLLAMLLQKVCQGPPRGLGLPASLVITSVCLAALMAYGTMTESSYFRDNLTFYAYNVARAPHNADAESNYATVLAESGMYGAALERFADVVKYHPTYWTAIFNLGLTYYKTGRMPQAEEYFLQAIRVNPNKPDQYFYLAMAQFKSGQTPQAIAAVRQAIAIRPTGYAYHFALGVMLKTQGDRAGALREFKTELGNYPEESSAAAQVMELEHQLESGK